MKRPDNVAKQIRKSGRVRFSGVLFSVLILSLLCSGCVATRGPVTGLYDRPAEKVEAAPVSVLFYFRNLRQNHGMDAIPKIQAAGVKDFDNLFRDALNEFGNIGSYATFRDLPDDVNRPERRAELAKARAGHDYTVEVVIAEDSSFKQQCFSGTVSLLSLALVPMPYDWDYTISANVYDRSGKLLKTYQRQSTLSSWVQAILVFWYPFYPEEGKREEIYSIALHDIFRQIEANRVLRAASGT